MSGSEKYLEGQVWEYRTRRGEEHSVLKIQRVGADLQTNEPIFHISIIGLKCAQFDALAHAPVSQATLDKSVIRLATAPGEFPDADEGITEWQRADGGVYSVSVAEIVEMADFKI